MSYFIWSYALLLEQPDAACCFVGEYEWNRLYNEHPVKRLFAKITYNNKTIVCALGAPIREALIDIDIDTNKPLFIPYWAFENLTFDGLGSTAQVEWLSEEHFPDATRLVLRPHDYAFYNSDIKAELEGALTRYGVLQKGTTIPIAITGDYTIQFDIVELEPASVVLMQGDEVAIEFEKSFNELLIPSPPLEAPKQVVMDDSPMVPVPSIIDGGHLLGGANRRLPDGRAWNRWRV